MKKIIYVVCLSLLFLSLSLTINSSITAAYPGSPRGTIVNFTNTEVPIDTTVHNIVVVGSDITIAGKVNDEVVVVNGNAILKSTAVVRDRVVVLGGDIKAEEGAAVGKGIYKIGREFMHGNTAMSGGLIIAGGALLLIWLINTSLAVALVAIPLIISLLWKNTTVALSEIALIDKFKTVIIGILGGTIILSLIILIGITGIGIPVAFLLMLFTIIAVIFGLTGLCATMGRSLPFQLPYKYDVSQTLSGSLLLVMIINLPVIGLFSLILFLAAALGSVIIKLTTKKHNTPR